MKQMVVKLWITGIATCIGILFVVLVDRFAPYASMLLGIEVLVLPTIYIVGHLVTEQQIQDEHKMTIDLMRQQMRALDNKYYKERARYLALNAQLKNGVNYGENHD